MTKSSMRSLICCVVWLLMCLKLISSSSQPSTKLSPRIVKTKYGQLRGLIIDFTPTSSAYADFQQQQNQLHESHKPTQPSVPNETAQLNSNKFFNLNDNLQSSIHSSSSTSFNSSPGSVQIEAFLGVSYAQPPIGDRRFLPPVSPSHWRGKLGVFHISLSFVQ